VLGHSTAYCPQGNGLAESSNKRLDDYNKESVDRKPKMPWRTHLKYALWANRIGTKKSIGMSPFQLVYGTGIVLPINLALPVMKLWHDGNEEPNNVTRRMNQIIKVQQNKVRSR
jgi:hypothetical protein